MLKNATNKQATLLYCHDDAMMSREHTKQKGVCIKLSFIYIFPCTNHSKKFKPNLINKQINANKRVKRVKMGGRTTGVDEKFINKPWFIVVVVMRQTQVLILEHDIAFPGIICHAMHYTHRTCGS